jgi:hypothetical protein
MPCLQARPAAPTPPRSDPYVNQRTAGADATSSHSALPRLRKHIRNRHRSPRAERAGTLAAGRTPRAPAKPARVGASSQTENRSPSHQTACSEPHTPAHRSFPAAAYKLPGGGGRPRKTVQSPTNQTPLSNHEAISNGPKAMIFRSLGPRASNSFRSITPFRVDISGSRSGGKPTSCFGAVQPRGRQDRISEK